MRVAGSWVRAAAKLIDGLSGGHIWVDRYEGDLCDIFGVQDEITQNIALAMQVKLTYGESIGLWFLNKMLSPMSIERSRR